MDIFVRKSYKMVQPFVLKDLPNFIVLTGENGTGKTQLLEYLYEASHFTDDGFFYQTDEEMAPEYIIPKGDSLTEGDVRVYEHPAEIVCNGKRLVNAVLRKVQEPTLDVGESYNYQTLYSKGENIAQKYLWYKTQSTFADIMKLDFKIITDKYQEMLGIKNNSNNFKIPTIEKTDLEIIKRIENDFPNSECTKVPFYYIIYQKKPDTNVFTANLRFLFLQYWARKKAGMDLPPAPWKTFNDIANLLNFKFELDEPKIDENKFDVRLRDRERKIFISPKSLSSGEKVIFSLFVAMYSATNTSYIPDLLMFDEPDAYLHPTLSNTLIKVITEEFVNKYNIKVIITTHSPSTVAIVPESSIFRMKEGKMEKCNKNEAIHSLTTGLKMLSIYYENIKQVFVEADNDNRYLSQVFYHASNWGLVEKDIQLRFINVGNEKGGGCATLKKVVNSLAGADNKTVFGIMDGDTRNGGNERIKILGNGNRYAIDNYYADPIAMALIMVQEAAVRKEIGFDEHDSLVKFSAMSNEKIQLIINNIVGKLRDKIPTEGILDDSPISYKIADGRSFNIPAWFMKQKGHTIVDCYKQAFPFLNKYRNDKELLNKIYHCYDNYPCIIPMDVIDTLRDIQKS